MGRKKKGGDGGLVYSTDHGRMCPGCGRPKGHCQCAQRAAASKRGSGVVRVGRETKGRKGKGVTVVTGLDLGPFELADLAKHLRSRCGAGGTVRDGVIEIQGEHRDAVVEALAAKGIQSKKSGS